MGDLTMETIKKPRKVRSDKGVKRGTKETPASKQTETQEPAMNPTPPTVEQTVEPKVEPTITNGPTLVDKGNRFALSEGVTSGVGFAFCKRDGNVFSTVGPISTCKDYLNEVVYTENTKTPSSAYGYKATYTGCFESDCAHLVIGILGQKNYKMNYLAGGVYEYVSAGPDHKHPTYDKELDYLKESFKCIELLLNSAEEMLNVAGRTKIQKVANVDNRYIVTMPIFWTKYTYLISLFALIIRIGVTSSYKGGLITDVLTKCRTSDAIYAASAKLKMHKMAKGVFHIQTWTDPSSYYHYKGISWAEFPTT